MIAGGEAIRASVVVLNYATPSLTIDCLASLAPEIEQTEGARVVVVDNRSPDESAERIERAISEQGWERWARLVRAERNAGFSGGNNVGIRAQRADAYILLNSDTIVRPGAIRELLAASESNPAAGIIGPRLEWPSGEAQESAFRYRSPRTEMLMAAGTSVVTRLLGGRMVGMEPIDEAFEAEWVSFACVLIRREVIDRVGLLDEGYFMYFEDADLCRRARLEGFSVMCWPRSRVVHLRGGTSSVKADSARRARRPAYYYASRSRYYAKFYGPAGLWATNMLWGAGRLVALAREVVGSKQPHACEREWADNWTNWREPLRPWRRAA